MNSSHLLLIYHCLQLRKVDLGGLGCQCLLIKPCLQVLDADVELLNVLLMQLLHHSRCCQNIHGLYKCTWQIANAADTSLDVPWKTLPLGARIGVHA